MYQGHGLPADNQVGGGGGDEASGKAIFDNDGYGIERKGAAPCISRTKAFIPRGSLRVRYNFLGINRSLSKEL